MARNLKTLPLIPYRLLAALGLVAVVPSILLLIRILDSQSYRFIFMYWNLFLALVPLVLAWFLIERVRQYGWIKWQQIALTFGWIVFLPNSFYVITDYVHVRQNYEADIFYDIVMMTGFVLASLLYGFISVYIVHRELLHRQSEKIVYGLVASLFLLVSFAICLGRYTRWNTWDIVLRPAGLLFDVSDRFLNPQMHLQTYATTAVLFVVLTSVYIVIFEALRLLKRS